MVKINFLETRLEVKEKKNKRQWYDPFFDPFFYFVSHLSNFKLDKYLKEQEEERRKDCIFDIYK
jgi:hypothetical protein